MNKKFIIGNWKMYGSRSAVTEFSNSLNSKLKNDLPTHITLGICPPTPYFAQFSNECPDLQLGFQDCHTSQEGAYTGDVSVAMAKDLGARFVIVGHSERRTQHKETSAIVSQKAEIVHKAGLIPIVCVGESAAHRAGGEAEKVVEEQLINSLPRTVTNHETLIAYEPVWAIGTGKTASLGDIEEMHAHIESVVTRIASTSRPILYGGSVKPENAAEILHTPLVSGALIGGASLKAESFWSIAHAAA